MLTAKQTLRDYQEEHLRELVKSPHNTVVQSPTGTGKSIEIFTYTHWRHKQDDARIMILAPNRRIVDTLGGYFDSKATRAYSGTQPDYRKSILISTYQSAAKHKENFSPDVILTDEAHHIKAATWQKLLEDVETHGWTATPNRLDGQPLYPTYKNLIISPPINWFIKRDYLAPYDVISVDCPLFSSDKGDALSAQDKIFGNIAGIKDTVNCWQANSRGKKTVMFATTIKHGLLLQDYFKAAGVSAVCIHNKMPLRDQARYYELFKQGKLLILINVQMFVEGVDVPSAESVYLCRFTYSLAFYMQMVGRVLRPAGNKVAQVVDLAGNVYYHGTVGLSQYWSLYGHTYREKTNKDSIYVRCERCLTELFHKRHQPEADTYSHVCCMECGHEQVVYGRYKTKRRSRSLIKESNALFDTVDFQGLDPDVITGFTRILYQKRLKQHDKIQAIVNYQDIPLQAKKRALLTLNLPVRTINYYLELD